MDLIIYMIICSFTPGPGNILSLSTTSMYGIKKSLRLILGIILGYIIVLLICVLIVNNLKYFFNLEKYFKVLGFIYMIYLAYSLLKNNTLENELKYPKFKTGFLLQIINIKIYFYITTLLTNYFVKYDNKYFIILCIVALIIGSIACFTWAIFGVYIKKIYNKHHLIINVILALLLIYCAIKILI